MISENCCNFIVLKYKVLQTIIAMISEDKVTELFCIADDFCKFFDAMMSKYTIEEDKKRNYHRESTLSAGSDAHHDTFPRLRLPLPEALLSGSSL